MAEIVNLRQARKRKGKSERDAQAEENRTKFGQTKAARKLKEAKDALEGSRLDGHKRPE